MAYVALMTLVCLASSLTGQNRYKLSSTFFSLGEFPHTSGSVYSKSLHPVEEKLWEIGQQTGVGVGMNRCCLVQLFLKCLIIMFQIPKRATSVAVHVKMIS